MHSRRSSLLVGIVCSTLLIAACGSSDSSATSSPTDATTVVTEVSVPATEVSVPATEESTSDPSVPSTEVLSTDAAVLPLNLEAGAGTGTDFCGDVQAIQDTSPDFQAAPDVLQQQLDDYVTLNQKIIDEAPSEAVGFLKAQLADQTDFIAILESAGYDAGTARQAPEFDDTINAIQTSPEEAAAFANIDDYCGISNS